MPRVLFVAVATARVVLLGDKKGTGTYSRRGFHRPTECRDVAIDCSVRETHFQATKPDHESTQLVTHPGAYIIVVRSLNVSHH